ncbi:GspH/FimT family pseudopilin [Endozoicomonas montiporae]|nr:GspH/FimT family pseudopilin [Endozoicomonas montiporae]
MNKFRVKGFTLLELLFTIAILSILAAIAYPSFQTSIQDRNLTAEINQIYGAILYARSEAAARHSDVVVCGSITLDTCEDNSDWSNGFIIRDNTANETIQTYQELSDGHFLHNTPSITFSADGSATTNTISLCDERGINFARGILLNGSGQPRMGGALSCQ